MAKHQCPLAKSTAPAKVTLNSQPHSIRLLTSRDGVGYQELRLCSLDESPTVFLSTYQSESKLHENAFADHLDWSYHPPHLGYFGLFVGEKLAAYVQITKTFLEKQEHIVFANNLYVSPDFRHLGLASELFNYVIDLLEKSEHIERIYLSCTAGNKAALHLYHKLGFRRFAVRTKAIKWQDQYDDEVMLVKILEK